MPNVRILQSTHLSNQANMEAVEFQIITEPEQHICRQVFLRTERFLIIIEMHTQHSADDANFNAMLASLLFE